MSDKSKNDIAWESLFEKYQILDRLESQPTYEISAARINEFREARLMTKFDHYIQLPQLFKQNDLTIQPNTRGTYLIGRFASYSNLPGDDVGETEQVSFPGELETINPQDLYSESAALLCAYNVGIIDRLLHESVSLTVLGRMSTGEFDYSINDIRQGQPVTIRVTNSQCEIDSGFEGPSTFAIVEAKNESVSDFLVRQLYYPYRLWTTRTNKEVIPMFLSYSNDIFSFYVFRFAVLNDYNSIELVDRKRYQIGSREIELVDIIAALDKVRVLPEPEGVPFPQADRFSRIVDLLTQLSAAGSLSQEDITTNHAFDVRQTQYYTNAGRYLGLVQVTRSREDGVVYSLTPEAAAILIKQPPSRNLALVERILEHGVFNEAVRLYLSGSARPTLDQVEAIMQNAGLGLDREGNTTIRRRAQTVLAWVDWIIQLTRV
jgi:hypothetical protein